MESIAELKGQSPSYLCVVPSRVEALTITEMSHLLGLYLTVSLTKFWIFEGSANVEQITGV